MCHIDGIMGIWTRPENGFSPLSSLPDCNTAFSLHCLSKNGNQGLELSALASCQSLKDISGHLRKTSYLISVEAKPLSGAVAFTGSPNIFETWY